MYDKEQLISSISKIKDRLSNNKYLTDKRVLQALALTCTFGMVAGVCANGAEASVNVSSNPTAGISSVLASNSSAYTASATAGISSVLVLLHTVHE